MNFWKAQLQQLCRLAANGRQGWSVHAVPFHILNCERSDLFETLSNPFVIHMRHHALSKKDRASRRGSRRFGSYPRRGGTDYACR